MMSLRVEATITFVNVLTTRKRMRTKITMLALHRD